MILTKEQETELVFLRIHGVKLELIATYLNVPLLYGNKDDVVDYYFFTPVGPSPDSTSLLMATYSRTVDEAINKVKVVLGLMN